MFIWLIWFIWCGGGGCVASGDTGGAAGGAHGPACDVAGLPVESRENAASASGKFGGVAGVLHGVISCWN